jgi:hypothetical protein
MIKLGLTWRQQPQNFWKNIISILLSGLLDLSPIELCFSEIQLRAKEYYKILKPKINCWILPKILSAMNILKSLCKNVKTLCLIGGSRFLKTKEV